MQKFQTRIASVRGHHLHVRCGCGYFSDIAFAAVPVPPETKIADVLARLRCARCKTQNVTDARLVWKGEGFNAQQGSRTRESEGFRFEDITGTVER